MPTTYLAPNLQDQGNTGATGTTPCKPATTQQVNALQDLYNNSPVANALHVVSVTATVININFNGTKNNGQFPATGESPTNVSQLTDLQIKANGRDNTIYLPGVGAQTVPTGTLDANGNPAPGSSPSNWDSIPFNAGDVANGIVKDAYKRLNDRVETILAENPNAEISINLPGVGAQTVPTGTLDGMMGGGKSAPPPPEGAAHFSWDADGQIQHTIDHNQSGGGTAADQAAASVQDLLEQVVQMVNEANAQKTGDHSQDVAINPYLLPRIHFSGNRAWMEVTQADGSTTAEGIGQKGFAERLISILQDNGGLAPAWQVATVQGHWATNSANELDWRQAA